MNAKLFSGNVNMKRQFEKFKLKSVFNKFGCISVAQHFWSFRCVISPIYRPFENAGFSCFVKNNVKLSVIRGLINYWILNICLHLFYTFYAERFSIF
jgi:hypothetical protein